MFRVNREDHAGSGLTQFGRAMPTALDGPQHLVLLGAQHLLRAHALAVSARDHTDTQSRLAPGHRPVFVRHVHCLRG